jgi:hypothetical protein
VPTALVVSRCLVSSSGQDPLQIDNMCLVCQPVAVQRGPLLKDSAVPQHGMCTSWRNINSMYASGSLHDSVQVTAVPAGASQLGWQLL